jgi:hypothetical protein
MPIAGISQGLGLGGGATATISGAPGGGGGGFTNSASVDFDGVDDYMSVAANASLDTTGDWSFSCWLYADDLSAYEAIAAKRTGGNNWQFAISSSKLALYLPWGTDTLGSTTLSTGQWYHIAFTVEVGESDGIKLYVNGSAESNTGNATSSGNSGNYGFTFADNTKNRWWDGKIDEIAMFHSALSASDISDIYNSGEPASLSSYSPVGWWRMGDGTEAESGTTIYDMSDNSNNGTLTNGPTYSSSVPS